MQESIEKNREGDDGNEISVVADKLKKQQVQQEEQIAPASGFQKTMVKMQDERNRIIEQKIEFGLGGPNAGTPRRQAEEKERPGRRKKMSAPKPDSQQEKPFTEEKSPAE